MTPTFTKHLQATLAGQRTHAIINADCMAVGHRLPENVFGLTLCDPPFGMSYRGWSNSQKAIANDDLPFIWWLKHAHRATKPGGALICFCNWKTQEDWRNAIRIAGWSIRSHVLWDKGQGGMGHTATTFAPRHEVIWFATKGRFRFQNGRPDSVLPVANIPPGKRLHSTEKPQPLLRELIRRTTVAGDVVYDPTMGSGSAGAAAIAEGRGFIGVELDDENYKTASKRIQAAVKGASKTKGKPAGGVRFKRAGGVAA